MLFSSIVFFIYIFTGCVGVVLPAAGEIPQSGFAACKSDFLCMGGTGLYFPDAVIHFVQLFQWT